MLHDSVSSDSNRVSQAANFPELSDPFPPSAPTANPVFYRTYSRRTPTGRENWEQVIQRTTQGLVDLGNLTPAEADCILQMQRELKALPAGRWLWVGGTPWIEKPENFSGAYNCTSTNVTDWRSFGLMMDLAMMGCGTGAILEPKYISQLPAIRNRLKVVVIGSVGQTPLDERLDTTHVSIVGNIATISVGDSRQGWVQSYQALLELSSSDRFSGDVEVIVDVRDVRPEGETLKGFGGVANPIRLPGLYGRCAAILNKAVGRQLTSVECCLLIDEAAATVVAGNIRRSAGIRQGSSEDEAFAVAKDNLWQQGTDGTWRIDPERDALRMANHTRVFHHKPTEQECVDAVYKQFASGEGAIQYAPEAIVRSNRDVLTTPELRTDFLAAYIQGQGAAWLQQHHPEMPAAEIEHRLGRYGLNPCLRGDMRLLTADGYQSVASLAGKNVVVINKDGIPSHGRVWLTGQKEVCRITLSDRQSLYATSDHRWMDIDGHTVETADLTGRRLRPYLQSPIHDPQYVTLGFCQGDGQLSELSSHRGLTVNIGRRDREMLAVFAEAGIDYHWQGDRKIYGRALNVLCKQHQVAAVTSPHRVLPATYSQFARSEKAAFLNGLYSANGSVIATGRITFKTTSRALADQIIATLRDDFEIAAYCTTNKPQVVNFANGSYQCRESYDVNIQQYAARLNFFNQIGFSQDYKTAKLRDCLWAQSPVVRSVKPVGVENVYDFSEPLTHWGVVEGFVCHNCGEIVSADFHCNLAEVHLNRLDPFDFDAQRQAFTAASLSVAVLLHHQFTEPRYQYARELDPIVGVSFTGLFDFFVHAFGVDWLRWWAAGRPRDWGKGLIEQFVIVNKQAIAGDSLAEVFTKAEQAYLSLWRSQVEATVWEYCDRHGLKRPNRCTTVQPAGTKSLLTGASSGWHPPKAQRFIRRITFGKNDPVALACIDYGYSVVPSQSDKDDQGNLLNDPFDPRCTEWLVEIPMEVSWANFPGADEVEIEKFSALAQFEFYMQVQQYYTRHNTSATIELTDADVKPLAQRIYQAIANDEGYISAALLARYDAPFPRLPFEKIDKVTFDRLQQEVCDRRRMDDFHLALKQYDQGFGLAEGPAGCDSDKCLLSDRR